MVEKVLRTNLGIDLNAKPKIDIEPVQDKDEKDKVELPKDKDLFDEQDEDLHKDEKRSHDEL